MTQHDMHDLEEQLTALRPAPVTDHLRRRLAVVLNRHSVAAHRPPIRLLAWPVSLSAAAILLIATGLALWLPSTEPQQPSPPTQTAATDTPMGFPDTSLGAYMRAWHDSPERLDALLQRQVQPADVIPPTTFRMTDRVVPHEISYDPRSENHVDPNRHHRPACRILLARERLA